MKPKYLDLKMDFMFKQLFGDPRRKSITIAFLNDLLHRKEDERIVDVQYENTELSRDTLDGKTTRLDVVVYTSTNERINVEIQMVNQHDMPERILYYWAKLLTSSLKTGENYSQLVPTIMISILNFPLFPHETDSFHTVFKIIEEKEQFLWSPHLEFHAIDLSRFMVHWKKYRREMKESLPTEYPWLMMLSAANFRKKTVDEEIFCELEALALNEHEVREALIEWETLSANKENKVLYEARLKYLRDQLSNIMGERREGRKEASRMIAKNLLTEGMSIEKVAKITELSEDEVKDLQ